MISSVIDMEKNDEFSKLKNVDLTMLIRELEARPLGLRTKLDLPENTTFGLEIEFEDAEYYQVSPDIRKFSSGLDEGYGWKLKTDGTVMGVSYNCKETGGEVISPILRDETKSYEELNEVCDILKFHKAVCEDKAGGHIHVGAQAIGTDFDTLLNFAKMWTAFEKEIFRFSYGDKLGARGKINYGKPISAKMCDELVHWEKLKDYRELMRVLPSERGNAVNFENIRNDNGYKDTIEFRCPNGTTSPVVWQNNVNFFVKMLRHCKAENFNTEALNRKLHKFVPSPNFYRSTDILNVPDALELCDMVFDKNLDKAYFLKQYVKNFKSPVLNADNIKSYTV
jgi:hypothetical protein